MLTILFKNRCIISVTSMKSQNRRKNARGFSIFSEILGREANAIIKKKYHSYLSYRGIKEDYIYILKEGVVKTSVIMRDGREFNFSYLKATDIVSLLRDEVSNYTDSPFKRTCGDSRGKFLPDSSGQVLDLCQREKGTARLRTGLLSQ